MSMTDRAREAALITLFILVLSSTPSRAQMSSAQIASAPANQVVGSAMFQFGRTRYFRALVNSQACSKIYPERSEADETRFRAASKRLGDRFGARSFDIELLVTPFPGGTWGQPCEEGTLGSYERKISELANWADRADILNLSAPRP